MTSDSPYSPYLAARPFLGRASSSRPRELGVSESTASPVGESRREVPRTPDTIRVDVLAKRAGMSQRMLLLALEAIGVPLMASTGGDYSGLLERLKDCRSALSSAGSELGRRGATARWENPVTFQKTCDYCGETFTAKNSRARFCPGSDHRQLAFYRNNKVKSENTAATRE